MNKERIESLKYMRVVAMLLVVLIHTTAVAISNIDPESPAYFLYLILNRFTRFEGAVFVCLSGIVLFYNYADRPFTMSTWKSFYRKRFLYIIFPYIIWSLFYEVFSYTMGTRTYEGFTTIITNLLLGNSFYQLYFILILVQLYFLLPIFIYFVKKWAFVKKYLFLIGFVLEFLFQILNRHYQWINVPFFMVYIASFFLGGWIGLYYQQLKNTLKKKVLWILTLSVVGLGILYTCLYYYRNILGIHIIDYPLFKLIALTYYLFSCYVLFKIGIHVEQRVSPRVKGMIERLRIYSFGFYLVHPFILILWEKVLVANSVWEFHLFIFIRYILVVVSCFYFIRLIHILFPNAWMIFGKLPSIKGK